MEKLRVALNSTVVGALEKYAGGAMSFVYHEEWLAQAGACAISLSLPLQPELFRGDAVYNFFRQPAAGQRAYSQPPTGAF